jgi:hypothetical protein
MPALAAGSGEQPSGMPMLRACEWLAATPWSVALHESHYAFLVVLTVHVLALTVFLGTVVMIDRRLVGLALSRIPASDVLSQALPWSGVGLALMLVSGALLFYAEPVARFQNVFFRIKMLALVAALLNTWHFHRTQYRRIAEWDRTPVPPASTRAAAAVSLLLWATVLTMGRMIPYQRYWFD